MNPPKKLNDKIKTGTYKNYTYSQAIESDPIYINDKLQNYGLILDEVAQAYFNFHFYRSQGLKNPMF